MDCCLEVAENTEIIAETSAVFDVGLSGDNKYSTNTVNSQDDVVISSAADKKDSAITVFRQDCEAVPVDVDGLTVASIYTKNDSATGVPETVEQHESTSPSDYKDTAPNVLPVIEVNHDEVSKKLYKNLFLRVGYSIQIIE